MSNLNYSYPPIHDITKGSQKLQSNRTAYIQIHSWSKNQLIKLQKQLQNNQTNATTQILQQQKKVIISMLLQIIRLTKQQCKEKGMLIQQMLNYSLCYINQHQKYYDMLSYLQIKHFRDSLSDVQKQYSAKNKELKQQISKLMQDKQHRWRNIFMVVKDNRVLRRQRAKILKKYKQQLWKTKNLQQDIINLRSQNEKYKLLCQQSDNQQQFKQYISNQLLLVHLDSKIKQHPGRARRLLKKQLVDSQIKQLNTLSHKIKFIVQSMEENCEVCQDFDDWDDNQQTTRLFYNVSVQTYCELQSVGVNTITPVVIPKVFQSTKCQSRPRDLANLIEVPKLFDIKIINHTKKLTDSRKKIYDLNSSISKMNRKNSAANNTFTQPTYHSNFNDMYYRAGRTDQFASTFKQPMRIFNCMVSVKINPNKNKTIKNTQTLEDKQKSSKLIEQDLQNQRKISHIKAKQINPRQTNLLKVLNLKKQSSIQSIPSNQEIQTQIRKRKQTKKIYYQIYQIFYKPVHKTKTITNEVLQDDILSLNEDQGEIFLQEKHINKQANRKKDIIQKHEMKRPTKVISNKQQKNKNTQNMQLANKYYQNNRQTIYQILQTQSNASFVSQQHFQQQNNDKNKLKEKFIQNLSSRNTEIGDQKIKQLTNFKRHRRQKTQDTQIKKINKKAQYFIKNSLILKKIKQKPNPNNIIAHKIKIQHKTLSSQSKNQKQNNGDIQKLFPITEPATLKKENKLNAASQRFFMKGQKIVQKFMGNILVRRKQIIRNPQNIKCFIDSFLSSLLCGNVFTQNKAGYLQKFFYSFKDSFVKQNNNANSTNLWYYILLQKLLSFYPCQILAEDKFVLFALILDKLHSFGFLSKIQQLTYIPTQYGLKVIQYICSIYLSPQQTLLFLNKQIKPSLKKNCPTINIILCYLKFIQHIQNIILKSQLWQFFISISQFSAHILKQSEISQILYALQLIQTVNQPHINRLKLYTKGNFALHRFCLYAYRFQWKSVYSIKSWINTKYYCYCQQFLQTQSSIVSLGVQILQILRRDKKFPFLQNIMQTMLIKNKQLNQNISIQLIKLCKIILFIQQVQQLDIFPNNLQIIHTAYCKQLGNQVFKQQQSLIN